MRRSTVIAGLASGLAAGAFPSRSRAAETIRVSTAPSDAGLEALYGEASGIPLRFGIDFDLTVNPNADSVLSAVLGGSLDAGLTNAVAFLQAREQGRAVALIAPASIYVSRALTAALMVEADSAVHSARDLNGRAVALDSLAGVAQLATLAWIDQHGGSASSVRFVEVAVTAMPAALAGGRVDAALIGEPALAQARETAHILGKPYDSIAPQLQLGVWFASESWIAAHQDLSGRFNQAMLRVATWSNNNPHTTGDLLARNSRITPQAIANMIRVRFADKNDPALLQPVIEAAVKYGMLQNRVSARDLYAAIPR